MCRDKSFWRSQKFIQNTETSQVWKSYLKTGWGERPRNVLDVKCQRGSLTVTSGVPQSTTCYLWLGPNIRAVPSTALSGSLGAAIGFHLEDKLEQEVCQVLSCNGAAVKANGESWVSLQSWFHHWVKQGWSPGKVDFYTISTTEQLYMQLALCQTLLEPWYQNTWRGVFDAKGCDAAWHTQQFTASR